MIKINLRKLQERCLAPIDHFRSEGEVVETKHGLYIYKDNGSNVLAVAHLDTVQNYMHFWSLKIGKETFIFNAQLDDRLGAYVILDLLPELGITTDILLTEGEEIGQSTAQWFEPQKEYNWMFSFDRTGRDVVMYHYHTPEYTNLLRDYGFVVNHGTFSDICWLDHLEVTGFNFGVGYYDNHSKLSHAILEHTIQQVSKFTHFYRDTHDLRLPYKPSDRQYRWYDHYDYDVCDLCDARVHYNDLKLTEDDLFVCKSCLQTYYRKCLNCNSYYSNFEGNTRLCQMCRYVEEYEFEEGE